MHAYFGKRVVCKCGTTISNRHVYVHKFIVILYVLCLIFQLWP